MSYATRFGFHFYLPEEGKMCFPKNDLYYRRSGEWIPDEFAGVGRSFAITHGVIYPRQRGLIPNYAGHVPGKIFTAGYTFGRTTINSKAWLEKHKD